MTNPVKLFVIGSCRVHKPVNNLNKAGIISLPKCSICNRNCEGTLYCNSTNEIIQYLLFLRGRINNLSPEIQKLISVTNNQICPGTIEYVRKKLEEAELIIIEVSSVKNLIYWEKAQPLYLNLAKYKSACINGNIIATVQTGVEEYEEILENLETILSIIPERAKVLLVSHMNPGKKILSRSIIEMAIKTSVAKYSGIMYLNPTIFVDQLGGIEKATIPGKEKTDHNADMIALIQEYIGSWIILEG